MRIRWYRNTDIMRIYLAALVKNRMPEDERFGQERMQAQGGLTLRYLDAIIR